jgi:hypothetical protein
MSVFYWFVVTEGECGGLLFNGNHFLDELTEFPDERNKLKDERKKEFLLCAYLCTNESR